MATFSRQGNLYDLAKIKVFVSRELYQSSCGIEGLWGTLPLRRCISILSKSLDTHINFHVSGKT